MYTLLLRLSGPLQSWGSDSKYEIRRTNPFPTKSGITGMIAASLGRNRDDDISDLSALRFGVRIDKQGTMFADYQTGKAINKKDRSKSKNTDAEKKKNPSDIAGNRYYLQDAKFLVGLECADSSFLNMIMNALLSPQYQLYMGRRACPVSLPLVIGISEIKLEDALQNTEWLLKPEERWKVDPVLHIFVEVTENVDYFEHDRAISFSREERLYEYRPVQELYIDKSIKLPEHNPMKMIEV